jgi:L-ascorbate metabolism protein UlaG (beta-lactamase superfamily)
VLRVVCLKIFYHGHAAFQITTEKNSILIDPHDGYSIGLKPIEAKGDLILITHEHFDHNAKEYVSKPNSVVISTFEGEKELEINGEKIKIKGKKIPHDPEKGKKRGFVAAYLIEIEGYRLLHMGDVGALPAEDFFEWIGKERMDMLYIPVGGYYTIGPMEAWELGSRVNPRYLVPMHYWRKGMNLPISPLSDFLKFVKAEVITTEQPFSLCDGRSGEKEMKVLIFKGMDR